MLKIKHIYDHEGNQHELCSEQGKEILQMSLAAEISSKDGVSIKISDSRLN